MISVPAGLESGGEFLVAGPVGLHSITVTFSRYSRYPDSLLTPDQVHFPLEHTFATQVYPLSTEVE